MALALQPSTTTLGSRPPTAHRSPQRAEPTLMGLTHRQERAGRGPVRPTNLAAQSPKSSHASRAIDMVAPGAKRPRRRCDPLRRDGATRSALPTSLLVVQTSSRRPAARPALGGFRSACVSSHAGDAGRGCWSGRFRAVCFGRQGPRVDTSGGRPSEERREGRACHPLARESDSARRLLARVCVAFRLARVHARQPLTARGAPPVAWSG
jgi:hypothetical protein